MEVCVTGASGFIGRHLVAALVGQNVATTAVTRSATNFPSKVNVVSVSDYKHMPDFGDDALLVHLAENRYPQRVEGDGEDYIEAAVSQLESVLRHGWRYVVYASSAVVYGDLSNIRRRTDELVRPMSVYGRAKRKCEELVLECGGGVARLSNVVGPNMAENSVLADILRQIPGDGPLYIRNGSPIREFLYIDDAITGILALLGKQKAGIFNFSGGEGIAIAQLAEAALYAAGEDKRPVISMQASKEKSIVLLDLKETRKSLDWSPQTSLNQMLKILVRDQQ